ncbi:type IV pilus biogenesis protein PilM [Gimesia fumaroli]|uniref:Competence protein A n=1 Tax=Gimesia fumaroli TaxID=2527976 RepID=A0A518IJ57_9PLAN|nr:hypothetical protein [Gimesia fumaroli]QDV53136.1 Competence protein A [Gimesia fumaroli]
MADYLAINWEKTGLSGVEAHTSGSAVSVKRAFHIAWPDELHPARDPISAGSWLKNEFSRLKIASKQILISFPRHDATIRLIEIPDVPLEEVPEIVRFQTATKSSVPLGQLMLDYLLLPAQEGKATRDVLVASISKDLHQQSVKTFQSMGLEIVSTGISSLAAAEWVSHIDVDNANLDVPTLIVNQIDHHLELSLISKYELLFSHSTSISSGDQAAIQSAMQTEINRFLLSRSAQLGGQNIELVFLIGDPLSLQDFTASLGERLHCRVEVLDPLLQIKTGSDEVPVLESPGVLAGPLGMLYAQSQKKLDGVDFLHPHKAEEKPDRRKLQIGLGVAGVVLILLTAMYLTQSSVADLDDQIAERKKVQKDLDEFLKRGQPTLESVALIDEWENSNSKALKIMQELDTVLPGTDRVYLSELDVTRSAGQSISRLRATGHAKDDLDVRDLNQQLSNNNYRVHPKRSNNTTTDPAYPVPFEIDAERLPAKAEPPQKPATEKNN